MIRNLAVNAVFGGAPARSICSFDELAAKLEVRGDSYPCADLVTSRRGSFYFALEPILLKMRQEYFFGGKMTQS